MKKKELEFWYYFVVKLQNEVYVTFIFEIISYISIQN